MESICFTAARETYVSTFYLCRQIGFIVFMKWLSDAMDKLWIYSQVLLTTK